MAKVSGNVAVKIGVRNITGRKKGHDMKTIATGYLDGKKVNIVRISHNKSKDVNATDHDYITAIELDDGTTDLLDYVDRLQFIID